MTRCKLVDHIGVVHRWTPDEWGVAAHNWLVSHSERGRAYWAWFRDRTVDEGSRPDGAEWPGWDTSPVGRCPE